MKPTLFQSEVYPAILATNKGEFVEKWDYIARLRPHPGVIQIDVADGKFVPNTTWITPARLAKMDSKKPLEIHLMTENPAKNVLAWKKAGATQVVFHYEAVADPTTTMQTIRKAGLKAIMAINPSTSLTRMYTLCAMADGVLVMGVQPGFSGQKAYPGLTKRIQALRARFPHLLIEADGGVIAGNMNSLREAGASILYSGSAYFV